jgi:hypothetical protein
MNLYPVICDSLEQFIEESQKFIKKNKYIKSISVLEKGNDQYVCILCDDTASDELLKIWWNGYQAGLGNTNE